MKRGVLASVVVVLLFASAAEAYVLPAQFLLKMLAEKRRDQKIVDISVLLQTELRSRGAPFDEHLYLKQPARQRRVEDETGAIYVEREGKFATGNESGLKRGSGALPDLTATLLAPGNKDLELVAGGMAKILAKVGVDLEMTALGRNKLGQSKGDVVFIIGARSWEPDKPQLWLNKNTLLPVRLVAKLNIDGKDVVRDIRLMEYGSAVAGNWFPRVIEEYENGELVRRAEVIEVKLNQNLPETLFEIP